LITFCPLVYFILFLTYSPTAPFGEQAKSGGGWGEEIFARKPSAPPPARIVESRDPQKNVLILLEEKIGRVQIKKYRENFFCWTASISEQWRGGKLVLFKVSSDIVQQISY